MERNLIIPAFVAATVHALIFIPGSPVAVVQPPERDLIRVTPKDERITLPEILKEETETVVVRREVPPAVQVPTGEENFSAFQSERIPIVVSMRPSVPDPDTTLVSIPTNYVKEAVSKGTGLVIDCVGLDNPPRTTFQNAPIYPTDLRKSVTKGTARIEFSVDVAGRVFDAEIVYASHHRFGEEAMKAVRQWRFEPGMRKGAPVAFRMIQAFHFRVEN